MSIFFLLGMVVMYDKIREKLNGVWVDYVYI